MYVYIYICVCVCKCICICICTCICICICNVCICMSSNCIHIAIAEICEKNNDFFPSYTSQLGLLSFQVGLQNISETSGDVEPSAKSLIYLDGKCQSVWNT